MTESPERVARLHLCRHGEVDPSWHGKVYGSLDVDLAEAGRQRFDSLAEDLRGLSFAAIYASPLRRALDGAKAIARHHELEVQVDDRLREIDRGDWSGVELDELERGWPGATRAYLEDPDAYAAHGGESHADLRARIVPALEDIAQRHRGGEVLAVCHAQVMRVAVAWALGIPGDRSLNLMTGYGGLTTMDRYSDGAWVVQAVNAATIRRGQWGGRTFKP